MTPSFERIKQTLDGTSMILNPSPMTKAIIFHEQSDTYSYYVFNFTYQQYLSQHHTQELRVMDWMGFHTISPQIKASPLLQKRHGNGNLAKESSGTIIYPVI